MEDSLDRQALSFSRMSYRTFKRRLVFQRPPRAGESRTNAGGFPTQGTSAHIDIDAANPIPCNFTVGARREITISGQVRTVTTFKVTIPSLYKSTDNGAEVWIPVDFASEYQAHVLEKNALNPERFFQVVGEWDDMGPDITFDAIELKPSVQKSI